VLIVAKIGWAAFLAIFSQTHPVTLVVNLQRRSDVWVGHSSGACVKAGQGRGKRCEAFFTSQQWKRPSGGREAAFDIVTVRNRLTRSNHRNLIRTIE
jgi:hypothetical protein